jgi:hypothetical protein|nr:hypothetical protein [Kofleriaceae bacterium]
MNFFLKAVVTGFALSLGAAIFKKVGKRVGLVDEDKPSQQQNPATNPVGADGATDPNLQHSFS